jgi:hypothetical protein
VPKSEIQKENTQGWVFSLSQMQSDRQEKETRLPAEID